MAFDKIKQFIEQCENQLGKRLKVLRTDRGGEFVNFKAQQFFKNKGILHQLTAPYTPQQNGVAERKNRSLMEMARCMLFDAKMEIKFWAEAVYHANYIQNRILSAAVNSTPFELWYGKPPKLNHVHIFGAVAYAQINKQKRKKLDEVAVKCNLVGYAEESKAFRLLNTETNKIIISRDVKFLEMNDNEMINVIESGVDVSGAMLKDDGKDSKRSDAVNYPLSSVAGINDVGNNEDGELNYVESDLCILNEDELCNIGDDEFCGFESTEPNGVNVGPRKSSRVTKGIPPKKYGCRISEQGDPMNYKDVLLRSDKPLWIKAMEEELKALKANNVWSLVELPKGAKVVGCKWVYKVKKLDQRSNFEITDLGDLKLYLGIEVLVKNDLFYLSQERYINKILDDFNLQQAKTSSIPMDPGYLRMNSENCLEDNNLYRKAIGSMLYVSNNTRPDIAVAISILSRKVSNPNENDWNELKRVMKYLKGTKGLKLCVGSKSSLQLKGFADADWAGELDGRKSTSGFIFKLGDAVISYASRKQANVTLSSTEAEFVSLAEASQEFLFISQLMEEFQVDVGNPRHNLIEREIIAAATLPELDEAYTRRVHNFPSTTDLYRWSSSLHYLEHIDKPMIFINAKDDPIVPEDLLSPIKNFAASRHQTCYIELAHGGHLGFYEGGLIYQILLPG
ncbi:Retrovirus-related Pol polyprotein from transposon TNT 1-94 [Eumeta japonica]|uniref:Retrovirus-related Pol polyprotein from transposon TNT 1-94 n=1 Tax=Eumeta variegata TaxID=151549 RepID=A0A4C1SYQ5_EUMVA|nr:Retrovirus-related Pol polyprotein from transposon TNT 1-94 [Eumeta japonica]